MEYDDQDFDGQYSEYFEYSESENIGAHDDQGGSARFKTECQTMAREDSIPHV